MKRPTVASLQKQIADLTAKVASTQSSADTWKTSYYETLRDLRAKQTEIDSLRASLEREVAGERRAREAAESTFDNHRAAVMAYLLAVSNPATSGDKESLVALQANICNMFPSREVSFKRGNNPFEQ